MDFIKDQNPTALYEVGIKAGEALPDYVKEAAMLQEEDVANLADSAFADRVNRLHPIHTKEATYMSAVYLAGAGLTSSEEFATVKRAAEFYGIDKDVEDAIALLEPTRKEASEAFVSTEKFALSFNMEEEDTWSAYPINSELEVTKAATEVVKDWVDEHIPTDWLRHAAINIVKRANELNISRNEIPDKIWNLGAERLVDFDNAESVAASRCLAGVADTSAYLDAVKQAAAGSISVEQAVDQWMLLDAQNSVSHKRYTSPQEAFYSGASIADIEKLASSNVCISDVLVPVPVFSKLASTNMNAVLMAFRPEVASTIINIAKELDSAEKVASASARVSKLNETQRKELLNVLMQVS